MPEVDLTDAASSSEPPASSRRWRPGRASSCRSSNAWLPLTPLLSSAG